MENYQQVNIERIQYSSSSEQKVFSILIPTWNNLDYLKLCLRSIEAHSTYKHQLIIHINEGQDETAKWLAENVDADVNFSAQNVGICHALNAARELMTTSYLLYMNDDMYAAPGWDAPLKQAVDDAADNMFFYSGTLMQPGPFPDKSIIAECNYGRRIEEFDEASFLNNWTQHKHQDWNGATWPPNIVHVDVWDRVGGYSVEFSPGMYSDPDFSKKLWEIGVRDFRGIDASRVYHFESVSTGRVKKNKGSITFLKKWNMTSATFGRHFLRRGTAYRGPLEPPRKSLAYYWDIIRSRVKKYIV